jgi:dTDP-glucose 4,6-dehydratase
MRGESATVTKRILLTGAAGFLGAHTLRYLLENTDWDVICPVTFRHKGVPERLTWAVAGDQWHRVAVLKHDCATPVNSTTGSLFGQVDVILNLASDTHPPRSVAQPVEFIQNNVNITLHLLEWARSLDAPPLFVQVSTDAVYGPATDGAHVEGEPHNPNNPYAASKAAQEDIATAYWRTYRLPVMIAATMNPTGITQDREKFIPMTIGKLLRGEEVVIHSDADGRPGARTYIAADDVADALVWLITAPMAPLYSPTVDRPARWNIVGTREMDNLAVMATIADELGIDDPAYRIETVDRPEHGHRYAMSGAKLARAGWRPQWDIDSVIRLMAKWTEANPLWLR